MNIPDRAFEATGGYPGSIGGVSKGCKQGFYTVIYVFTLNNK
jgi:hypothetical protein